MKKWNKLVVGALSAAVLLGSVTAYAAPVSQATVDLNRTGSLSVYKYDLTRAEEGGVDYRSFVATGEENKGAMEALKEYAVEGVTFSYLKVADLFQETTTEKDGSRKVELLYGLEEEARGVIESIGMTAKPLKIEGNVSYYESNSLNDALNEAMQSDMQGKQKENKNKLETFMSQAEGAVSMPVTDRGGFTRADHLALGLYLVVQTTAETHECNTTLPFFVSLPMTDVTGDHWNYDVTAYPKSASSKADLKKEVAEITTAKEIVYNDVATASSGDLLHYQVTSHLPSITSQATYLTKYTFRDVMDPGLTYLNPTEKDVQLFWYAAGKTAGVDAPDAVWKQTDTEARFCVENAKESDGRSTMTITMTEAGLKEINQNYTDGTVMVDYGVRMNADTSITTGDAGMPNEVTLTYKRTADTKEEVMNDECRVFTYGMDLTKTFSDQKGDATKVSFVVKNLTDGYYVKAVKFADGIYYVEDCEEGRPEQEATVFYPAADGHLKIYGLEDDSYTAVETATDEAYLLLKEDIDLTLNIALSEKMTGTTCTHNVHHKVAGSATVNAREVTDENGIAQLSVVNNRGFDIPETGETGAFLLPIAGMGLAALMVVGGFYLAKDHKKSEE